MGIATGHGATLVFAQFGTMALVRTIGASEYSGAAADKSHLGTPTWREYLPPDLYDLRPFTVQALADTEQAEHASPNAEDTLTLTLPVAKGEVGAATLVGLACFTRIQTVGPLASNQEHLREYEIQWLAKPTYTPATNT